MSERIKKVDSSQCNTKELTREFLHLSLVFLVKQMDSPDTHVVCLGIQWFSCLTRLCLAWRYSTFTILHLWQSVWSAVQFVYWYWLPQSEFTTRNPIIKTVLIKLDCLYILSQEKMIWLPISKADPMHHVKYGQREEETAHVNDRE